MKRKPLWFVIILFILNFNAVPAWAQSTGRVVADCTAGVAQAYAIGSTSLMTMLANGVACTNASGGGGGGLSVTDQAAFTQGASQFTPNGGVFNDTATLSSGQQGTQRYTTKRAGIVDVDTTGNALYSAITAPIPAGTNLIGKVGIDQTTPGTTNGVQLPATQAGGVPLGQALAAASVPVVLPAAQITTLTPPTTVTANGAANVTPTDCSGTITSGGAAQNAIAAQTTLHGFTIANIDTGHNAEVLWISFTTTATASTAASYPLPAPTATTFAGFGSFTTPPGFGTNHAVSIIGATTGHIFSCSWW